MDLEPNITDRNVLQEPLKPCGVEPLTGFYRTGSCETGPEDAGVHVVCSRVTQEFLDFSTSRGNDLSRRGPNTALRASSRVTAGVCARQGGEKRWRRASRRL